MFFAISRISSGREDGICFTHSTESFSVIVHAWSREIPISFGARAASDSLVPPQSGQVSSRRNFSTRFIPFSSLTLFRALSTVAVAL